MRAVRWIPVGLAVLALALPATLALTAVAPASAQVLTGKRLILKDGSWQAVTKYEVHGDRVRYFSVDREEWEEIPNSLIDWTATEKWNKAHIPGASPDTFTPLNGPQKQATPAPAANPSSSNSGDAGLSEAAKIDAEAAAVHADLLARTPRVAPGLHLPDEDGIFVLDNFQSIPELVELSQHAGNVNRTGSHNVFRAAIDSFHGAQEPVRIDRQAAKIRIHVDDPALYVSLDNQGAEITPESALVVDTHGASSIPDKNDFSSPDSRYAIVRVQVRPGERVIGAVQISRVGGVRQNEDIIPTTAEILPGKHWMKLMPKDPLTVGEYALMEILGPGQVNLDVWDFGVSPNAPENQHPITPIKGRD